jgi:hypothetical protein
LFTGLIRAALSILAALCHSQAVAQGGSVSGAVRTQLALPEHQIDVGIAALTIAKEVYPGLDIQAYSARLDDLARKTRWLAKGTRDPETRIRVLNTVLFRHEHFRYDHAGFAQGGRKEHYYLNGILDLRMGNCFTMPLLYVAVAQRLEWPIYPVTAPSHLFVRYVDPAFARQNIETTSGGKHFEDEWYIKDFSINSRALGTGGYMRTLSYKEYLGHILYGGAYALENGRQKFAYVERAVALDPRDPNFWMSLSEGYLAMSKNVNGEIAADIKRKSRQAAANANRLGFVDEIAVKVGRSTRGQLK